VAELTVVDLLTGASEASVLVKFVRKPGVLPKLAGKELIAVSARNGACFVVVRETAPPGGGTIS
jgi:hypothetical protein